MASIWSRYSPAARDASGKSIWNGWPGGGLHRHVGHRLAAAVEQLGGDRRARAAGAEGVEPDEHALAAAEVATGRRRRLEVLLAAAAARAPCGPGRRAACRSTPGSWRSPAPSASCVVESTTWPRRAFDHDAQLERTRRRVERDAALPAGGGGGPLVAPSAAAGAGAGASRSGTRPRKTGLPSARSPSASRVTAQSVAARRSPTAAAIGSQTNVTRDCPAAGPRSVPTQNRAGRPRAGSAIAFSAFETAGAGPASWARVARATSSGVYAQYPLRARTSTFGRFTRTSMLWNLPSVGARRRVCSRAGSSRSRRA